MNIQTYEPDSKSYQVIVKVLEMSNREPKPELFVKLFKKIEDANTQLVILNTLNSIIARGDYLVSRPRNITSDIQTTLLRSVRQYGEKAFPLSDRQIEVLAEDFAGRAASGKELV